VVPATEAARAAALNRTNDRENFLVKNQDGSLPDILVNRPQSMIFCTLNPIRPQKAD